MSPNSIKSNKKQEIGLVLNPKFVATLEYTSLLIALKAIKRKKSV